MLKDVIECVTIASGKTIILDLNGKTIECAGTVSFAKVDFAIILHPPLDYLKALEPFLVSFQSHFQLFHSLPM